MRSKTILSTAAFVLAFACSTAFASLFITTTHSEWYEFQVNGFQYKNYRTKSPSADKISAFINQDKRNGIESDRTAYEMSAEGVSPFTSSSFPAYVSSVEQYVDASSSMKTRRLPNDFQLAWREHMKAWSDYSDFLNRIKKPSVRAAWSEEDFTYADASYNREISRTWYEVLRIGRNYGADVSD